MVQQGTRACYAKAKLARLAWNEATRGEVGKATLDEITRDEIGKATLGKVAHGKESEAMSFKT